MKGISKLLGSNRIIIIIAIITIPAILYVFVDFWYKNRLLSQKEQEKRVTQESFDGCIGTAYGEYRRELRNMCWVYNHEATDCDLSYFKGYSIDQELPADKLKKDLQKCEDDYPAKSRLYSGISPDIEIEPYGQIKEREAFSGVMKTQSYKDFLSGVKDMSGYKISYETTIPTKDNPYWAFRLYYYSSNDEKTFRTYKVDAISGELFE